MHIHQKERCYASNRSRRVRGYSAGEVVDGARDETGGDAVDISKINAHSSIEYRNPETTTVLVNYLDTIRKTGRNYKLDLHNKMAVSRSRRCISRWLEF